MLVRIRIDVIEGKLNKNYRDMTFPSSKKLLASSVKRLQETVNSIKEDARNELPNANRIPYSSKRGTD